MNSMLKLFTTIFLLALSFKSSAQMVDKGEGGIFLLKGGQVYDHEEGLQGADLLIKDGMIAEIGPALSHPEAKVVDCTGLEIYPGMIDSGTKLGLAEISSVSLTQDYREIGTFTPHMEALTAVNPSSVNIPVNRVNGVTTVLTVPSGGLFPGKAALINLHGYTPEQMYAGFKAPLLQFPSSGKRGRWDRRSEEDIKKDSDKALKKLNKFWKSAQIYARLGKTDTYNPQMAALIPVMKAESPLLLEVNKKSDILNALAWVNKNKVDVIMTGLAEGYRVLDSLVKYDIPVITGPILDNPSRASDKYDISYANAGKMQQAGLRVAIRTNETENVRNLPYNAGFAAAYGMGKKEAFKAITQVPADLFGVGKAYGSLEKGKIANLFVTNGDPFETITQVQHLFIRGWKVPLESRHTLLYDEFLERDPGLRK